MFLRKVYKENKFLFYVILLFCAGQAFFMFKGVQNAPFFLYGMYSAKQVPQEEYTISIIEVNGQAFDLEALPYASRELISGSLQRYRGLDANNFRDTILETIGNRFGTSENFDIIASRLANGPSDRVPCQQWLKKYLEQCTGDKIDSLKVFTGYISYQPELRMIRKEILFEVK